MEKEDRPRIIGPVATAFGDEGVNIAGMKVARQNKGQKAITVINADNKVDDEALKNLAALEGIMARPVLLKF